MECGRCRARDERDDVQRSPCKTRCRTRVPPPLCTRSATARRPTAPPSCGTCRRPAPWVSLCGAALALVPAAAHANLTPLLLLPPTQTSVWTSGPWGVCSSTGCAGPAPLSRRSTRRAAASCWRSSSARACVHGSLLLHSSVSCALTCAACPPVHTRVCCSGRYGWPAADAARYPQPLRDLVAACLDTDHAARPSVAAVRERAEGVQQQLQLQGGSGGV